LYNQLLFMRRFCYFLVLLLSVITSCSSSDMDVPDSTPEPAQLYFPPLNSTEWETTTPASLNWNSQNLAELNTFLENNETRAFIILIDGKIVIEEYWNQDLSGNTFTASSNWYWASAGKSLAATVIGIAQEQGHLDINDKTSDYLGNGWTFMSQSREDLITVKNNLTFTTGIDYNVSNENCTAPGCFEYSTDAGDQWYYHNGTYQVLHNVLESATGVTNNEFTTTAIKDKIGMDGQWTDTAIFDNLYISTARSAARFGLLTLNKGNWDGVSVLGDAAYFNAMTNSSQDINPSYGYLWWLNGKGSTVFPGSEAVVNSSVTPAAPADMISALGKNGQFIDVVPSLNMVVIRMGDTSAQEPVPILFHDALWQQLQEVIN